MRKVLFLLAGLVACYQSAWAAVPNDFDGDGVSDRTWVEVAGDKTLTWKTEASTTKVVSTIASLGSDGDLPIMAQWLSGGTQIGVASLNKTIGQIEWSIRDSNGNLVTKAFGESGDLVVAGADFNGNGQADAAVVRLVSGKARWTIAFDLFASANPEKKTITFGKTGDRAFYARAVDGSSTDWIGITRKGSRNRSSARLKEVTTGQVITKSRLPKFASQGNRPRAFPIRQPLGPDLLGFTVTNGSGTAVRVYSLDGVAYSSVDLKGTGTTVVGDFLPSDGYEVLFQSASQSAYFTPHDIDIVDASQVDGTLVDEINIGALGESVSSTPNNDSGSGSGGSISSCSQTMPWPSGHIYKTIGSEHFSDIRRNTIGIVLKPGARGPYPSCVEALDTDGHVVAKLGLYSTGNGWAARYYAGIGCGSGTPYNGASVAGKARQSSGSSKVYMNFGGVCYGPIEASQCIGSKQC